jgi:hypothetical protein
MTRSTFDSRQLNSLNAEQSETTFLLFSDGREVEVRGCELRRVVPSRGAKSERQPAFSS